MTDTVDAIMDAAERRIREAGYSGFSFRDIAADVGVKSASVHYHFPTKDDLVVAVTRRYNERVLARVEASVASGLDIVRAWTAVFRQAVADGGRMCLCGALGAASPDLPAGVSAEVRRFFVEGVSSLEAGGLTRPRAIQVLAALEGAILMANAQGDPAVFDLAVEGLG